MSDPKIIDSNTYEARSVLSRACGQPESSCQIYVQEGGSMPAILEWEERNNSVAKASKFLKEAGNLEFTCNFLVFKHGKLIKNLD